MKRNTLLLLGSAALLVGCSMSLHGGPHPLARVPCVINVSLDASQEIVVDTEPARTKVCRNASTDPSKLTWKVTSASGYKFHSTRGVEFPPGKNGGSVPTSSCGSASGDTEFVCTFPAPATNRKFFYDILLVRNGHPDKLLDPTVMND